MADDTPIKVTVSGETVYKAVKNFLLHDDDFRKKVDAVLAKLEVEETLSACAERAVEKHLSAKFMYGVGIDRMLEKVASKLIAEKLDEILNSKIQEALKNRKFVVLDP